MKTTKKIAWMLSFVLVFSVIFGNINLKAVAAEENFELCQATSVSNGVFTTANGTATVTIGGVQYTGDSQRMVVESLDTQIVVTLTANEGKKGVLRTGGESSISISSSAVSTNGLVTTYTFTLGELGVTDVMANTSLNIDFEDNNSGGGNLTFQYDNTGLGFGYIEWKDAEGNWHTQQENGTVNAIAVKVVYSNNGTLANHTEFRIDGSPVLSDNKRDLESENGLALSSDKNYAFEHIEFIDSTSGGDGSNPPGGGTFDGTVYFVWQGANDALCVHKITGLDSSMREVAGQISFDIIYIPVSTVKDDNTTEQFVIGNENYYWVWGSAEDFIRNNASSYSAFISAKNGISDPGEFQRTFIDPCGAKDGDSSVCTNGDRQFRATIYNDTTFEGVAFSQDEDDYTYFPGFWDNVFFTNTVDISNTTAANPAIYEAFLLEPTIHFGKAEHSVQAFTQIRALNVPDGAVTITGDAANGYDIQFGSNFFDNVVFEITTANGNYYLEIVRTAIRAFHEGRMQEQTLRIGAEVYYDSSESYSDYEVYATIHYTDGSVRLQKVEASEIAYNGAGDPMPAGTYEMEAGKGLKCAHYSVLVSDDMVGIDFNAVKSGALSGTAYGGSYFGSGNGVYIDVRQ